jgi:hypothetical protein
MKLRTSFLALVPVLAMGACATTTPNYTPFQAAAPGKFGFTDQRIEADRYRVIFEGNSRTTRQRVEDSLLLRAANLTLENGYTWFQVVNRATDPKTYQIRTPSIGSSWGGGFGYRSGFASYRSWSPRFGWIYHRDPFAFGGFYNGFGGYDDVRDVTRFQASAEILLGKGPKPTDRVDAFDARDVSTNLTPRLNPPVVPPA